MQGILKVCTGEKLVKSYTVGTWAKIKIAYGILQVKLIFMETRSGGLKIWQYNTTIIRNPDIIHPGEVLRTATCSS